MKQREREIECCKRSCFLKERERSRGWVNMRNISGYCWSQAKEFCVGQISEKKKNEENWLRKMKERRVNDDICLWVNAVE